MSFNNVDYMEPLEFETVTVTFPIHLREIAKFINEPVDVLEELNPQLRQSTIPPNIESYELRVPVGNRVLVERAIATIKE